MQRGYPALGPFPADTIFLRAERPDDKFDGIVTMYHDQGQIAIKLKYFGEGITMHAGLPIPTLTPAHGTGIIVQTPNVLYASLCID